MTAFKHSAGAHARTMPTYDDGTTPTLTSKPLAVRTANTSANGCGISEDVTHTIDAAGPEAVAFAQNTRDEVRIQGDDTISGALSAQPGMKQQTYVCMASGAAHAEVDVGGVSPTLTAHSKNEAPLLAIATTCSHPSARRTGASSSSTINRSQADGSCSNRLGGGASNALNPWDVQSRRVYTTDDAGPTLCAMGRPREDGSFNVMTRTENDHTDRAETSAHRISE